MPSDITPLPGRPFPLGATVTETGTNFAVVADGAAWSADDDPAAVQLCLLGADGSERRIPMTHRTAGVRHAMVPGVGAGQRYGFRAAADPAKLLLDPYARRVDGTDYDLAAAGTAGARTHGGAGPDGRVPVGVVTAPVRARTRHLDTPWAHTVIYEAHVRGLTMTHPDVPPEVRGTYAGLAHPAVIAHLHALHVTAVELLPVHASAAEPLLAAAGRPNYWGYSTLGFFAPHPGYASRRGDEVAEFAAMVDALHTAGIEVILDVVYNHTCEGGPEDPVTLSWRGLAPEMYYLDADLTGTGNTLDPGPLTTVRMVTDSLRYWADELGVDGFRFDLAPVLGRPGGGNFDPRSALLTAIAADPVLRRRKLIAEPWDATGEGYALGRFGPDWAEWNDQFRDTVRDFWRGVPGVSTLAYRLSGSEDIFGGHTPWASINLVTAHDGFTLRDLVSYESKHNAANGQHGADGSDDNRSANHGIEGETDDPAIRALRTRQARNIAATMLLATGTPMITAGDEIWHTQRGNNNAYCHDSELVWLDWAAAGADMSGRADDGAHDSADDSTGANVDGPDTPAALCRFFARVLAIRAAAPALRRGTFFSGIPAAGPHELPDVTWFSPAGQAMTHDDWFDAERQTLGMWVDGYDAAARAHPHRGSDVHPADSWLLLLHSGIADTTVTLPPPQYGRVYVPVVDTGSPTGEPAAVAPIGAGTTITVPARTVLLLRADGGR